MIYMTLSIASTVTGSFTQIPDATPNKVAHSAANPFRMEPMTAHCAAPTAANRTPRPLKAVLNTGLREIGVAQASNLSTLVRP